MASPFRYFRKHQKILIAAAAVLCMVVFVFSDALVSIIRNAAGGGSRRSAEAIVATWDGGSLNEHELAILRARRFFLSEFLKRLQITGYQKVLADGGSPVPPNIPDFVLPENISPQAASNNVIITQVLADLADRTNMSVSDEVINNYLREAGFRRVGSGQIAGLLKGLTVADRKASVGMLFAALRDNLLAHYYRIGSIAATQTILPEERWEDWRRVNERIALEAVALPVEQFVDEVSEPTDAQLAAFYELYKNNEGGQVHLVRGALLPSPTPGFAQPRKIRLHYLLGDVFAWSEKMADTVSDEEIANYYDRNKRTQFARADTGEFDSTEKPEESTTENNATNGSMADGDANNTAGETAKDAPAEGDTVDNNTVEGDTVEGDTNADDPTQYQPLEEVRDTIRRRLATEKAVQKLKEEIDRLFTELRSSYNPYGKQMALAAGKNGKLPDPPELLANLQAVADEHGLIFEKSPQLSWLELARDSVVGKAVDVRTGRNSVAQLMFGKLGLYDPVMAQDIDGNWYLVLKVEDIPFTVPEFEDIRAEVVQTWKRREAVKLALEKAKTLATEAQSAGSSLADFFADKDFEVVTTDMFSWLTFGATQADMQRGPRLGEAPPLVAIGPEFMAKAFQLKDEEVIGLDNYDQSIAYVIRLHSRERTKDELRTLFLSEANNQYSGWATTTGRRKQYQQQVINQVKERAGLEIDPAWAQTLAQ